MISLGGELKFGNGVKGYELKVRQDPECELKIYQAGVELESSLKNPDSLAHKVFTRLSSFHTHEPTATEAQETPHCEE